MRKAVIFHLAHKRWGSIYPILKLIRFCKFRPGNGVKIEFACMELESASAVWIVFSFELER